MSPVVTAPASARLLPALLVLVALGIAAPVLRADDEQSPAATESAAATSATLALADGDVLTGTPADSDDPLQVLWSAAAFTEPVAFDIGAISEIQFPNPAVLPQPAGDYRFELAGGNVLHGKLRAMTDEAVVIEQPGGELLPVAPSVMRRLSRQGGDDAIYFGPSGLDGWQQRPGSPKWRELGQFLASDTRSARIRRDVKLPKQIRIEFEISWTDKPAFELAIGEEVRPQQLWEAFRFQVWATDVFVLRETKQDANVMLVQKLPKGPGRIRLEAFLDQQKDQLLVYAPDGTQLADLTVAADKQARTMGIELINKGGDIRLERIAIHRWNGELPDLQATDATTLVQSNGKAHRAAALIYDVENRQFVVSPDNATNNAANDDTPLHIDEQQVREINFAATLDEESPNCVAVRFDGGRLGGQLLRIADQRVWLQAPGIEQPISAELAALRSLVFRHDQPAKRTGAKLPGREGRLDTAGTSLHGCLVDNTAADGQLWWLPRHALAAVPLSPNLSAAVLYREPRPAAEDAAQPSLNAIAAAAPAANAAQRRPSLPQRQVATTRAGTKPANAVLHLRAGDMLSCKSVTIDELGVHIHSDATDTTFVEHSQIKVLELDPDAKPVQIEQTKKDRLLTLPRMQRDSPPTQLIRSLDGDYMRGRLLSMDDTELLVELHLENRLISRSHVSRLIWLHADEMHGAPTADAESVDQPGLQVQAVDSDGKRLTCTPEQCQDQVIIGHSPVLGNCRLELAKADRLLFGQRITEEASQLPFRSWVLRPAPEPLAPAGEDGDSDSDIDGIASQLVGKPAPPIELALLDGGSFRLAEQQGKVIVLDFWATWCGPCRQSMPIVEAVVAELADQGVELYTVNLQETPEQINQALERLEISPRVLLDRDGRVAESYQASAIPQAVIVDRQGNVARVYVGAGPRFGEQLRDALNDVLAR